MNSRWLATAGISLIVGLTASMAEAARASQPTLKVHLVDLAGIRQRDLRAAKAEAVGVFRDAGIDVRWATGPVPVLSAITAQTDVVALFLVNGAQAGQPAGAEVMGEAFLAVHRASVFYNRLTAQSRGHQTNGSVVLGRVMAHEIGHLLLPAGAHSPTGIMRPEVDFEITSVHSFTRDQGDAMRARLASHPSQD